MAIPDLEFLTSCPIPLASKCGRNEPFPPISVKPLPLIFSRIMKNRILLLLLIFCTQFAGAQVPSDSLVLFLPFDGNGNDLSGNNNHGTLHSVVPDTNRFGQALSAFRFNGVDSYVAIAASPSMNLIQKSNKVTISAWINIFQWHSSGNVFSIFERYNPTTDAGWLFEANWVGGGYLFLANETTPTWVGCTAPTPFNDWMHVALTYDKTAGQVKFYRNGQLVCDKPYSQDISIGDTTTSFAIGRSLSGPDEFSNGQIDDLKVFCRVLNETEIGLIATAPPFRKENKAFFQLVRQSEAHQWEVVFEGLVKGTQLEIVDLQGRIVDVYSVSSSDKSLSLRPLPVGVYRLRAMGFPSRIWVVGE